MVTGMNLAQYGEKTGVTAYRFRDLLVAHGVDVSHQTVWQWFLGNRKPSPKHFDAIEAASGGKVTRAALRPDIFGGGSPTKARKSKPANVNRLSTKRRRRPDAEAA